MGPVGEGARYQGRLGVLCLYPISVLFRCTPRMPPARASPGCDVLVIGGINAALCAALMASEAGASVQLLRSFTARMARRKLAAHAQPALHARYATGRPGRAYPEEEFWRDLLNVTGETPTNNWPSRDPRFIELPHLDAQAWRALSAGAGGHAAPVAHQRILHGRWEGVGQCVLPQRGASGGKVRCDSPVDSLELRGGRFLAAPSAPSASKRRPVSLPPAASNSTAHGYAKRGRNERGEGRRQFVIRGTVSTKACSSST